MTTREQEMEMLGGKVFEFFEAYISHNKVAPDVLGNPTKQDVMFFLGGCTAGFMTCCNVYDNSLIQKVTSIALAKIMGKYPSTHK